MVPHGKRGGRCGHVTNSPAWSDRERERENTFLNQLLIKRM